MADLRPYFWAGVDWSWVFFLLKCFFLQLSLEKSCYRKKAKCSAQKTSDACHDRISISSASPVHSSESEGIPAMFRNGIVESGRYRAMRNKQVQNISE